MSDLTAEMTAQYGPNGPVARAQEWLKKVLIERDFSAAWALMTPDNRLDFAQRWLWANRAHPLMVGRSLEWEAHRLAETEHVSELWSTFAQLQLDRLAEAYPLPANGLAGIGASSRPRVLAPDLELVIALRLEDVAALPGTRPIEGGGVVLEGSVSGHAVVVFAAIAMQHRDGGWLVASLAGELLPSPSWPPTPMETDEGTSQTD